MGKNKHKIKYHHGSSLIEMLVAVFLLSFLIVSGGMSALKSITMHRDSYQQTLNYILIENESE